MTTGTTAASRQAGVRPSVPATREFACSTTLRCLPGTGRTAVVRVGLQVLNPLDDRVAVEHAAKDDVLPESPARSRLPVGMAPVSERYTGQVFSRQASPADVPVQVRCRPRGAVRPNNLSVRQSQVITGFPLLRSRRGQAGVHEELRAVRVRAPVRHRQQTVLRVAPHKGLVCALPTGADAATAAVVSVPLCARAAPRVPALYRRRSRRRWTRRRCRSAC